MATSFLGGNMGGLNQLPQLGGGMSALGMLGMGNSTVGNLSATGGNSNASVRQDQNVSRERSSGETYYANPELAQDIVGNAAGVAGQAGNAYMDFLNNPTQHPIYQNALGGLLSSLEPSEAAGRMNLADTFRAAGNTASSTFADKAMGLESEFMRNRNEVASKLLTTMFPQVADSLYKPIGDSAALANALKLQQEQSRKDSQGSGYAVGTGEASGPMSTGMERVGGSPGAYAFNIGRG